MADLTELEQWEAGVYQLETTDPVEGGPNGIDNQQAKQLANRTTYLKAQLETKTAQSTEIAPGIAELATQTEVDAGTDDLRIVTPKKLKAWSKQASETVPGLSEIATQAETDTGTDDARFVTPKKLMAWVKQATESVLGMMKIATQAQTDAGTDDATAVTPKKMRWGFSAALAINGYIVFPSWMGGLIIQWGGVSSIPAGTFSTIAFPIAFPSDCFMVNVTARQATGIGNAIIYGGGPSNTQVQVQAQNGNVAAYYMAIGR